MNPHNLTRRRLVLIIVLVAVAGAAVLVVQRYQYVTWLASERDRLTNEVQQRNRRIDQLNAKVEDTEQASSQWRNLFMDTVANAGHQSSAIDQGAEMQAPSRTEFQCRVNAFGKLDCTSW